MGRSSNRSRTPIRRKVRKKGSFFSEKLLRFSLITFVIVSFLGLAYHYREGLAYYFGFKSDKIRLEKAEAKRISDVRNYQILENHQGKAIGLDVSEFQGAINWTSVETIENSYPLEFMFIRATAGKDHIDGKFRENWLGAKKRKVILGA